MAYRIIFMGTPEFGRVTLEKLIASRQFTPQLVITQPDKPVGRKQILTPPPVKVLAQQHHIEVWQPKKLKDPEIVARIKAWQPDSILVAAYGKIIPQEIIDIPPFGIVNVHASLLPGYRGASPIQYAILEGEKTTGVTIMLIDAGMDTGPILNQKTCDIAPHDTAESLSKKLAALGADLLLETLPLWLAKKITPQPQDNTKATVTKTLEKKDGEIKSDHTAGQIEQMIRAFQPWPGVYMKLETRNMKQGVQKLLKILKVQAVPCEKRQPPLTFSLTSRKELCLHTKKDCLILETVHPEGKKPMSGYEFWIGQRGAL